MKLLGKDVAHGEPATSTFNALIHSITARHDFLPFKEIPNIPDFFRLNCQIALGLDAPGTVLKQRCHTTILGSDVDVADRIDISQAIGYVVCFEGDVSAGQKRPTLVIVDYIRCNMQDFPTTECSAIADLVRTNRGYAFSNHRTAVVVALRIDGDIGQALHGASAHDIVIVCRNAYIARRRHVRVLDTAIGG